MRRVRSSAGDRVFAFVRAEGTDRVLVVLNFGKTPQQVTVDLQGSGLAGTMRDLHDGRSAEIRRGTLTVNIGPRGWALLAGTP